MNTVKLNILYLCVWCCALFVPCLYHSTVPHVDSGTRVRTASATPCRSVQIISELPSEALGAYVISMSRVPWRGGFGVGNGSSGDHECGRNLWYAYPNLSIGVGRPERGSVRWRREAAGKVFC